MASKTDKISNHLQSKVASVKDRNESELVNFNNRLAAAQEQEQLHYGASNVIGEIPSKKPTPLAPLASIGYQLYTLGMEIRVGMHLEVPLEMFEVNPNNPRTQYSEDDIEEMKDSIKKHGQLQAALAFPPTKLGGKMIFKEGHTRWFASQRLLKPTLLVEIVALPESELAEYIESRELNKRRNNLSIFDDAVRFPQILANNPQLAKESLEVLAGEKKAYVSKVLQIGTLPSSLIERMRDSKELFGFTMAYNVSLYFKATSLEETDTLIEDIIDGKVTWKEITENIRIKQGKSSATASQSNSEPHRRTSPLRRSEIKGGGKGELKLFPNGRIELKLMLTDKKVDNDLFDGIRALFLEKGISFSDSTA